jgi:hypothetical protein
VKTSLPVQGLGRDWSENASDAGGSGAQSAKVVNVANWSDADPNRLEPHEPEPTDVVVTLGSKH